MNNPEKTNSKQTTIIPTQIAKFLEGFDESKFIASEPDINFLWNAWLSLTRFLALLWASYFSKDDYDTPELDQKVHDLICGEIYLGNENLELCARVADFYKDKTESRIFNFHKFLYLNYHEFKMIASSESMMGASEKIAAQMLIEKLALFATRLEFFKDSKFEINFNNKYFQKKSFIYDNQGRREKGYFGTPRLRFASDESFPVNLFPFFIIFNDEQQQIQTLLFRKWDDQINISPCYQKLYCCKFAAENYELETIHTNDQKNFIRHRYLISRLFEFQENVTETPYYSHSFFYSQCNLSIKLYAGNMFKLNSLAKKEKDKNYCLVLVPNAGKTIQSKMVNYLKLIGESKCVDELQNRELSKGQVYEYKPEKLAFYSYLFCPIYNIEDNIQPNLDTIKETIIHIIDYLNRNDEVTQLICPAFGSYWGEGLRREVPLLWLDIIKSKKGPSNLQRIIFAFVEPTSLNAYKQIFEKELGWLDLENMYLDLESKCNEKRKELDELEEQKDEIAKEYEDENKKYNQRFNHLPFPLAQDMEALFGWESSFYSSQQFVERCLDLGLFYLRLSLCVFIRLGIDYQNKANSPHFKNKLQSIHQKLLEFTQYDKAYKSIRNLEHGNLNDLIQRIFMPLMEQIKGEFETYHNKISQLKSFFNPSDYSKSLSNIRNRIAHDGFSKPASYYDKFKKTIDEEIALRDVINSSFFLHANSWQLVYINNIDATDSEEENEIEIIYTELTGNSLARPKKKIVINGNIPFLKQNRVYILHRNCEAYKFTKLYPFVLYQECPSSQKMDLLLWKGLAGDSPIYQSALYDDELAPDCCHDTKEYEKIKKNFWEAINLIKRNASQADYTS